MKRNALALLAGAAVIGSGLTAMPATAPVAEAKTATTQAQQQPANERAVEYARNAIGSSYTSGGTTMRGGFDCSGLTQSAYRYAGKDIPRTSSAQDSAGREVSRDDIRVGDLVTYYSPVHHVAIYSGHGKIIHASRPGKPVQEVDMDSMPINSIRRVA